MAKKLSDGRKPGSGRKPGRAKTLAEGRKPGSGRKKGSKNISAGAVLKAKNSPKNAVNGLIHGPMVNEAAPILSLCNATILQQPQIIQRNMHNAESVGKQFLDSSIFDQQMSNGDRELIEALSRLSKRQTVPNAQPLEFDQSQPPKLPVLTAFWSSIEAVPLRQSQDPQVPSQNTFLHQAHPQSDAGWLKASFSHIANSTATNLPGSVPGFPSDQMRPPN